MSHVETEFLLVAGILAFYLFDSARLLHFDDLVISPVRGAWRIVPGGTLEVRGRFLHLPNPLWPAGTRFIAGYRNIVKLRIDNSPFDERIDQNVFLFRSDVALRFGAIERQYALIKIPDVLNKRPLEIETGFVNLFANFSQLEDNRELALIDRKNRRSQYSNNRRQNGGRKIQTGSHQRASRSRERKASRDRISALSKICPAPSPDDPALGATAVSLPSPGTA